MTKEEIAAKYIPCTCGEVYKSRNMTAPDCPLCQEDWAEPMDEWAIIFGKWIITESRKSESTVKSLSTIEQVYDLFIEQSK